MDARNCVLAASLGAIVTLFPAPLWAAGAPLRHLVFHVDTQLNTRTETATAVTRNADPARPDIPSNGMQVDTATSAASGTITIDVVAATADDGLVVDVSEDAPPRRAPKVRVAITLSGILIYDPQANITDEENSLLPFLARQMIPPGALQVGATWSRPVRAKNTTMTDDFRIASLDGTTATIAADEHVVVSGASPLDIVAQGRATYDATALVPIRLHFNRRLRQESLSATTTTDIGIDYELRVDSLATK
ncbi:MAG: hypothetical protein ABI346_10595 [Candidatus Baltobacteraceae bacterium]